MNGACNGTIFFAPTTRAQGRVQRSNIIKFQLQSQFQIFLNVLSQMKDIKHIKRDFHSVAWVMPQGWDLGGYRGGGRSNSMF